MQILQLNDKKVLIKNLDTISSGEVVNIKTGTSSVKYLKKQMTLLQKSEHVYTEEQLEAN